MTIKCARNWNAGRTGLVAAMGGLAILAATLMLSGGCAWTPPKFLYSPVTNLVEQTVETVTNTIQATNWVTEVQTVTNTVAGEDGQLHAQIVITPVLHGLGSNYTTVEFQTNQHFKVSYEVTTNAAGLAETAGSITNMFAPGFGGLVAKGLVGLLTVGGTLFGRRYVQRGNQFEAEKATGQEKLQAVVGTLTQGIESYREVARGTPQGQVVDQQLMQYLQAHQRAAGVIDIVAQAVDQHVDNEAAKELADKVRAEAARLLAGAKTTA